MRGRAVAAVLLIVLADGSRRRRAAARVRKLSAAGSWQPVGIEGAEQHRRRWSSRSTDRDGDAFVVRWVNPWVQATFRFRIEGSRVLLVGLDMGQGNAPIPPNTAYWDFAGRKGEQWKTAIGGGQVSDRDVKVQTPSGEYRNAVEVRTIDQQGQSMSWTFAPDIGLVRFGRGGDAYLLTSRRAGSEGSSTAVRRDTERAPAPRGSASSGDQPLLIGLDATPHGKSGGGKAGKRKALQQAWEAGMTLLHTAPKWNELEKSRGRYDLPDDADAIGEFADEHDLPIALNVRIVDTNQRSMPKDYERWKFDDEKMAERLRAALKSFPAVLQAAYALPGYRQRDRSVFRFTPRRNRWIRATVAASRRYRSAGISRTLNSP